VLDALLNAAKIWRGLDVEGMFDWFVTEVRMRFSGRCRSRSAATRWASARKSCSARRARGARDRLACRVGDDRVKKK